MPPHHTPSAHPHLCGSWLFSHHIKNRCEPAHLYVAVWFHREASPLPFLFMECGGSTPPFQNPATHSALLTDEVRANELARADLQAFSAACRSALVPLRPATRASCARRAGPLSSPSPLFSCSAGSRSPIAGPGSLSRCLASRRCLRLAGHGFPLSHKKPPRSSSALSTARLRRCLRLSAHRAL